MSILEIEIIVLSALAGALFITFADQAIMRRSTK